MAIEQVSAPKQTSFRYRVLWRQTPQSFRIGLIVLLVHLIVAITGPFWAPYGFSQMGTGIPLSGMSWTHPFGIDQLGRDVFSRVVHGSHIVILLSLSGTAIGLVSGYVGGALDSLFMRIVDIVLAFPFLVLLRRFHKECVKSLLFPRTR